MEEQDSVDTDEADLFGAAEFWTTKQIEVPKMLIDQIIGQEHAVELVKNAAKQRRHMMIMGTPGTGKSMLAKAMVELLPKEELYDILVYHNLEDSNNPHISVVPAGKGKEIVEKAKTEAKEKAQAKSSALMMFLIMLPLLGFLFAQGMGLIIGISAAALVYMAATYRERWETSYLKTKELSEELHKNFRYCVKCGRFIPFDAKICTYCGHKYE